MLGAVVEALLDGAAQALFPDWPDGRRGIVAAWFVVGALVATAVFTFVRGIPRAPAACAAVATAMACLLVMGPALERARERQSG